MSLNHTPIRSTVLLGVFIAACSPASAQERNPEERLLLSEAKTLLQAAQQQGRAQTITSIADMEGREVREAPARARLARRAPAGVRARVLRILVRRLTRPRQPVLALPLPQGIQP